MVTEKGGFGKQMDTFGSPRKQAYNSHSIVAGGLPETSYTTRVTPGTSLVMRALTWASRSQGSRAKLVDRAWATAWLFYLLAVT